MSKKRINNELTKIFPQRAQDLCIPFTLINLNENHSELGLLNNKTKDIDLIFDVPKDYPFKCPDIKLQKHYSHSSYLKWSSSILNSYQNQDIFVAWVFSIIKRPQMSYIWNIIPTHTTCLCCESLTCGYKWQPSKMFSDLVVEYITRRDLLINCSSLMQKYLNPIFDNEKWVLNNDIILHILKFVAPNLTFL